MTWIIVGIIVLSWVVYALRHADEITFDPPDNLRVSDRTRDRLKDDTRNSDRGWREANP